MQRVILKEVFGHHSELSKLPVLVCVDDVAACRDWVDERPAGVCVGVRAAPHHRCATRVGTVSVQDDAAQGAVQVGACPIVQAREGVAEAVAVEEVPHDPPIRKLEVIPRINTATAGTTSLLHARRGRRGSP